MSSVEDIRTLKIPVFPQKKTWIDMKSQKEGVLITNQFFYFFNQTNFI